MQNLRIHILTLIAYLVACSFARADDLSKEDVIHLRERLKSNWESLAKLKFDESVIEIVDDKETREEGYTEHSYVIGKNNKYAYQLMGIWPDHKEIFIDRIENGRIGYTRSYYKRDPKQLDVVKERYSKNAPDEIKDTSPVIFTIAPYGKPMHTYIGDNTKVREIIVNDVKLVEFEGSTNKGKFTIQMNPEQDFLCESFVCKGVFEVTVLKAEKFNGRWFPTSGVSVEPFVKSRKAFYIHNCSINEDLTDDEFSLKMDALPKGTLYVGLDKVGKFIGGQKIRDDIMRKRRLEESLTDKQSKSTELLQPATERGTTLKRLLRPESFLFLLFLLSVAMVVVRRFRTGEGKK